PGEESTFAEKTLSENVLPPQTKTLIYFTSMSLPTRANAVAVASGVVAITMFAAPLYCFLVIVHSDSYHKEYRYQHAYLIARDRSALCGKIRKQVAAPG